MTAFGYGNNFNSDMSFGLSGSDGYTPDVSLPAALKPRPLISNEREHANVIRLDTIEQSVLSVRKQEESDRTAIKQDMDEVAHLMNDVVNYDTQVGFVMGQLNQEMTVMEHNRTADETSLLNAINDNSAAINGVMENQKVLSAAEKSELILERAINISRATAKGAEAAASGVGTIPIFGPVLSNGAKVIADTAEAFADTAAAIKEGQILSTLVDSLHALRTTNSHPMDMLNSAVTVANSAGELAGALKTLGNRVRSMDSLNYQKVTIPGETSHSTAYISSTREYGQSVTYFVKPSSAVHYIHATISDDNVGYKIHEAFGGRDINGMGAEVTSSGPVNLNLSNARIVEFNVIIPIDRVQAILMSLQQRDMKLSIEERIGYFEQYVVRGIKPDNKRLNSTIDEHYAALHSHAHNKDISVKQVKMAEYLLAKRSDAKLAHPVGLGEHHYDNALEHRYSAGHAVRLTSTFRVGSYSVFEQYVGPFTHAGEYTVGMSTETIGSKVMIFQLAGHVGQVLMRRSNSDGKSLFMFSLSVDEDHNLTADKIDFECDRLILRAYVLNPISCSYMIGPATGKHVSATAMIQHKSISDHIAHGLNYDYVRRMISPAAVQRTAFGFNLWSSYVGNGNWGELEIMTVTSR